jgi:hypothetical protein
VAERFSLDPEDARRAAESIRAAGEELLAAHRQLLEELASLHGCWGDDELGRAFEKSYVSNAETTKENTGILATNVVNVGNYVIDMVKEFTQTDAEYAQRIDKLLADDVESWTEA